MSVLGRKIKNCMKAKVYILLNVRERRPSEIANKLRGQIGVKSVEMLEGSPEIIFTVEANGRRKLARLSISALESVENVVESVQLLPVHDISGVLVH